MAEESGAASTSMAGLSLDEAPEPAQPQPIAVLVIGKSPHAAACQGRPPQSHPPPLTNLCAPHAAGMAGSGKTTFMQRINSHLHTHNIPGYLINLDPAVTHVPYGANIDIRDTVGAHRKQRGARGRGHASSRQQCRRNVSGHQLSRVGQVWRPRPCLRQAAAADMWHSLEGTCLHIL